MTDFLASITSSLNSSAFVPKAMGDSLELQIDAEFAALIPPLTQDEFSRLEQSILAEGCREAIITWDNIIVDGHNRYSICKAHNIPYQTVSMNFADRNAVMLWMLQNQLARRNLNDFQRVELVRKCEEAIKAKARERQGTRTDLLLSNEDNFPLKSAGSDSRDELARMAGVGHSTYEHAASVLDNAPAPVVDATRRKELSINSAYQVTKLPQEKQQEVAERIRQGESPRKVVAEFKKTSTASSKGLQHQPELFQEQEPAPALHTEHFSSDDTLFIPFFEDILLGKTSPAELNQTERILLEAYKHSKRLGNNWLDIFERTFSAREAELIAAALKEHNVHEFTISIVFADLIDRLNDFQELGFYVQKVVILHDDNMGHDSTSAILLRYTAD